MCDGRDGKQTAGRARREDEREEARETRKERERKRKASLVEGEKWGEMEGNEDNYSLLVHVNVLHCHIPTGKVECCIFLSVFARLLLKCTEMHIY